VRKGIGPSSDDDDAAMPDATLPASDHRFFKVKAIR
jgi:hypothetical protein